MTSLLPPSTLSLHKKTSIPCPPSPKPRRIHHRCNAVVVGDFPEELLKDALHLDGSSPLLPVLRDGFSQLQMVAAEMPEIERWELLVFGGLVWAYLTARPGVLVGAIDAYVLAPLHMGIDSLLGRRNLKMSDFIVGERLGEGSFGVVYAGAVVPKGVSVEERVNKSGKRIEMDGRFKEKVILKKCGSHRSVAPIKAGFIAQVGRRKAGA